MRLFTLVTKAMHHLHIYCEKRIFAKYIQKNFMKGLRGIFLLLAALMLSACGHLSRGNGRADEYNDKSYAFHYKNLDSAMHYAVLAAGETRDYDHGLAEALNNKAFVYIQRMHYDSAQACLEEISLNTDNQIELAIADIQSMRLCQRRSQNKEFYDFREKARKRLRRIEEEESAIKGRLLRRMVYARTELPIVNSVYYYYVGLENRSVKALKKLDNYKYLRTDTAQFLNYLYQKGSQGRVSELRSYEELQYLLRCYFISSHKGYVYWQANAMQMLAECFASENFRCREHTKSIAGLFKSSGVPDNLLGGYIANQALDMFLDYGDTYQVAGTYRTLASCYMSIDDYESALFCLNKALTRDTLVNLAPDLVAGIREMMSVTYSELDDKPLSDYNRNIYLDLQERTRQDRKFEARAEKLDDALDELNIMIAAVLAMIVLLVVLLLVLNHMRRKKYAEESFEDVFEPIRRWKADMERMEEKRNTEYEEAGEKFNMERLKVVKNKLRAADNRAKISLAETVSPLIDRMLNEVNRLQKNDITEEERGQRLEYVSQLADKINEYNAVLTQWIELRRGMIGMNIESFRLQDVFDTVAKGSMAFALKGINLDVQSTDAVVKADRVLTLFMINTIADNARKHTGRGGKVEITACRTDDYVDISVKDDGSGMTDEQLAGVFTRDISGGHGFGLANCKGIIEKYRKTSRIFSVCRISAESTPGRGSRFTFRLPKGVLKSLVVMLMSAMSLGAGATEASPDSTASAYADSVYFCNVAGYYMDALNYADSVVKYTNKAYRNVVPGGNDTIALSGILSVEAAELRWLDKNLKINYTMVLDIRNEVAVAALALHNLELYKYNNKAYTSLFKELSADKTLPEYCITMQKSKNDKTVAVILLVLLLLSVFPAYYFLYYRHVISRRLCLDKIGDINKLLYSDIDTAEKLRQIRVMKAEHRYELLARVADEVTAALEEHMERTGRQMEDMETAEDEFARAEYENDRMYVSNSITDNCLSTLKHETMYYPARINQMVKNCGSDVESLRQVVEYYRDLYNILMTQVMQQTDSMVFENKKIRLDELLGIETDLCTCGDRDVLEHMFGILRKNSEDGKFTAGISRKDDRYVVIETVIKSRADGADLFAPRTDNIPYLLCRRIIRDHSEATGLRGCGIDAAADADGKVRIRVKLTRN